MAINDFGRKLADAIQSMGGRCTVEKPLDEDTKLHMRCALGETAIELYDGIVTYLEIDQPRAASTITVYDPQRLEVDHDRDGLVLGFGDHDITVRPDGRYETSILL